MTPYLLALPLPPLLSEYYLNARRKVKKGPAAGKSYTGKMISPEGLRFRGEVSCEVRRGHRTPPRLSGPLSIVVLLCKATRTRSGAVSVNRKGDLDNRWKCLLDSLTHAEVIGDDVQFDDVRMVRGNPVEDGRLYLAISRFDPEASLAAAKAAGLPCEPMRLGNHGPDELPF